MIAVQILVHVVQERMLKLLSLAFAASEKKVKNRSRVEILYDIIASSRASAKKTHLMYKSNLSFKQLDLYLRYLLEQNLVEEHFDPEDASKTYFVTSKGLEFLALFENLQSYMGMQKPIEESKFVSPPEHLLISEAIA